MATWQERAVRRQIAISARQPTRRAAFIAAAVRQALGNRCWRELERLAERSGVTLMVMEVR